MFVSEFVRLHNSDFLGGFAEVIPGRGALGGFEGFREVFLKCWDVYGLGSIL